MRLYCPECTGVSNKQNIPHCVSWSRRFLMVRGIGKLCFGLRRDGPWFLLLALFVWQCRCIVWVRMDCSLCRYSHSRYCACRRIINAVSTILLTDCPSGCSRRLCRLTLPSMKIQHTGTCCFLRMLSDAYASLSALNRLMQTHTFTPACIHKRKDSNLRFCRYLLYAPLTVSCFCACSCLTRISSWI